MSGAYKYRPQYTQNELGPSVPDHSKDEALPNLPPVRPEQSKEGNAMSWGGERIADCPNCGGERFEHQAHMCNPNAIGVNPFPPPGAPMTDKPVRVWQIGPDGTEYYAAHSEEEMKQWYRENVGDESAEGDLRDYFEEVTDLDAEFDFNDDGEKTRTTWRKLAEDQAHLPTQISTGYN
jgi:hypothetical protein